MLTSPTRYGKLLVYAQWWTGDQDQMMALLRLIADLHKEPSQIAEFVMFPRCGTRNHGLSAIEELRKKFIVYESCSRRLMSGWPRGPNAMAMDVFKETYELWQAGKFTYDATMLMEADSVPLEAKFLTTLWKEWVGQEKLVLGHWDGSKSDLSDSHMNGNLLFHPSIVDYNKDMAYGEPSFKGGWDFKFWPVIQPRATPSRKIFSDYHLNTPTNPLDSPERLFCQRCHTHPDNPLVGEMLDISWLHGTKGYDAIKMVRDKLLS